MRRVPLLRLFFSLLSLGSCSRDPEGTVVTTRAEEVERIPVLELPVLAADGGPAPPGTRVTLRPSWVSDPDAPETRAYVRQADVIDGRARLDEVLATRSHVEVRHADHEPLLVEVPDPRAPPPLVLGAGPGLVVNLGGSSPMDTACEWVLARRGYESRRRSVLPGRAQVRFADLGGGTWTLSAGGGAPSASEPPGVTVEAMDQVVVLPCPLLLDVTVAVVPDIVPRGSRVELRAERADGTGAPLVLPLLAPGPLTLRLPSATSWRLQALRDGQPGPSALAVVIADETRRSGGRFEVLQPSLGTVHGCVEGMRSEDLARVTGYVHDAAVSGILPHVDGSPCFEGYVPAGTRRIGVSGQPEGHALLVREGQRHEVAFRFEEGGG